MAEFNPNVSIDVNKLTIEDIEHMLEATGKDSMQEILSTLSTGDVDRAMLTAVSNLVYVTQRKVNPDFTLEDAKKVSMGEFSEAFGSPKDGEEEDGGKEESA